MRDLLDLFESELEYTDADAADDAASEAKWAREKHVSKIITHVFTKLGLDLAPVSYPVNYDEDAGREVTVTIDGIGVPLAALAKLDTLGLGSDFKLTTRGDYLSVEFIVAETIDHAKPV